MKLTIKYCFVTSIFLIILLALGCQKNISVTKTLDKAQNIMNEYPDSSLNLLKTIHKSELATKEQCARYALLYSQALDKNYVDVTNDSLISIAVNYYKGRDDVKAKFLSYYYLGRVHTNAKELTQAILAYMEAEQLIDELDDDYSVGLLYNQMGGIYRNYYDFPKALDSYRLSTEYYQKAGKLLHKLYGMLSQSTIYKSMDRNSDSYHILYNTLVEAKETNQTSVVRSCLGDLIMVCLNMNNQQEALSFYNELVHNHSIKQMTSSFYANLGLLMAREKNVGKSRFYMNEAWKQAKDQGDSINLYHISSQIEQLFSSFPKAYSDLEHSITIQNKRIREVLQHPVLTTQKNFLNQELQHKEYKLKMEKYIRLLSFTILLLVSIIIIVFLCKRFQKKMQEKDLAYQKNMDDIQLEALKREQSLRSYTLELETKSSLSKQDIQRLTRELENSKQYIEETRAFINQTNQDIESLKADKYDALIRINKTLKNHFKQIENTYQVLQVKYKNANNRDKAIEEYILNTTAEFYGSKKADRNIDKLLNELYGDAMCLLRKEIKFPSEEHYKLVRLLLAGLSINFIAALSGETTNALYKRRDKIREIIKESNSACKDLCVFL